MTMNGFSSTAQTPGAQQITGLSAIPPIESGPATDIDDRARALLSAAHMMSDAASFVEQGWSFVGAPADDTGGLGVYRLRNGHLGLAGKALTIKFAPDASPDEIDTLLETLELRKRRKLGFGKNLMQVEMETLNDPFAKSTALARHPMVEFAEPVVVEQTGLR